MSERPAPGGATCRVHTIGAWPRRAARGGARRERGRRDYQRHITEFAETAGILASIAAVRAERTVRTAVPLHELYYRHHGQRLVDPKQRVLPTHPLNISPSQLLQARPDAFLATSRAA